MRDPIRTAFFASVIQVRAHDAGPAPIPTLATRIPGRQGPGSNSFVPQQPELFDTDLRRSRQRKQRRHLVQAVWRPDLPGHA